MFLLVLPLLFLYLVYPFLLLLVRQHLSPLRRLRGPPSPSFLLGNLMEMHDQENTNLLARWEREYGSVFTYRGFVGGCRLMVTDPVAVAHILAHAVESIPGEGAYEKPDFVRDSLATMSAGHEGLLTVEGEQHTRQRRILTPAFSPSHLKSLTPAFWQKAIQLRDLWATMSAVPPGPASPVSTTFTSGSISTPPFPPTVEEHDNPYPPSQPFQIPFLRHRKAQQTTGTSASSSSAYEPPSSPQAVSQTVSGMRIDVLSYLSRATLDVIGLTGFGYDFDSLPRAEDIDPFGKRKENELAHAFSVIFSAARKFRAITILQVWFPFLRRFRRNSSMMDAARGTMENIGRQLIEERTAALQGEKSLPTDRDLLSIMIRSNLTENVSKQMSVQEILCQISTFIAAGHETTSNALSWTLYALVQVPATQQKLRLELQAIEQRLHSSFPDLSSQDELSALETSDYRLALESAINKAPYLDAVIRESLRVHAPVTSTMRVCLKEGGDEIPVSGSWGTTPGKTFDSRLQDGYLDIGGVRRHTIKVNKWDIITIPIQAVNKSVALWGDDAECFRPERWENPPPAVRSITGVYSNLLSFLGGARSCIGYKFALTEMKIFLYMLLKDMEFSIDPAMVIEKKVNVVTRPFVKSDPHLGNQMPLFIRRAPRQGS